MASGATTNAGHGSTRRGAVIFAVLIVVVLSALIGWTMLSRADAQVASLSASMKHGQARAAAWSGIQAVMARLAGQREAILGGAWPEVDDEIEVFTEGGARGVARFIGKIQPEAGRVNVNTASAEMLVASRAVNRSRAEAIVAAAREAPFGSVEDVPGLIDVDVAGAQLWTAVSADLNVQAGVRSGTADAVDRGWGGSRRVNINQAWTNELGVALTERLGAASAQALKKMMTPGRVFAGMSSVLAAWREAGLGTADWGPMLDAVTTTEDEYVVGRVDLTTAPANVLACVPGISADAAELLVRTRARLDAARLQNLAWPAVEGVLTPEVFEGAVDFLTTRSLQWRVRIEAGVERSAVSSVPSSAPVSDWRGGPEAMLEGRVVYECVIDVSSARPRLALLRDVTLEGPMRAWIASRDRDRAVGDPGREPGRDLARESSDVDDTSEGKNGAGSGDPSSKGSAGMAALADQSPQTVVSENTSRALVPTAAGEDGPMDGPVDRRVGRWRGRPNASGGAGR